MNIESYDALIAKKQELEKQYTIIALEIEALQSRLNTLVIQQHTRRTTLRYIDKALERIEARGSARLESEE